MSNVLISEVPNDTVNIEVCLNFGEIRWFARAVIVLARILLQPGFGSPRMPRMLPKV